MTVLLYWNHEAWIVRQNVGRFLRTDQLDTSYLVWGLSPNATPALVGSISQLPPPLAGQVRDGLRQRYGRAASSPPAAGSSGTEAGNTPWGRSGRAASCGETFSCTPAIAWCHPSAPSEPVPAGASVGTRLAPAAQNLD